VEDKRGLLQFTRRGFGTRQGNSGGQPRLPRGPSPQAICQVRDMGRNSGRCVRGQRKPAPAQGVGCGACCYRAWVWGIGGGHAP